MATSVVFPRVKFFADNGQPLIGGRIHTYAAGSSTRARTYVDAAKAQPNANPIVLDSRGEAAIYLAEGVEYKFVIEDRKGALIMTQEPVYGAVWPNAAEWPSDATLAYQYMTDAKAAAGAIGPIKFYDTLAQAQGDIANLTEGDLVEIAQDEEHDGARTRRKFLAGALAFAVNLDQLRVDISEPVSGNPIGGFSSYAQVALYKGNATRFTVGVLATSRQGAWGEFELIHGATELTNPPDHGVWIKDGNGRIFARKGHQRSNAKLDWWAAGDGSTPDADALIAALNYGIKHGKPIYASAAEYLIEKEINLDTLSTSGQMLGLIGVDGVYYRTDTSGFRPTVLVGSSGLARMFYQPFAGILQRRCFFKNLAIKSKDPFDNISIRANLRAFDIFNSPYSKYENIEAIGITALMHLRTCWMTELSNITANRCVESVFIDGADGTGSYGFADHIKIKNISVGGYPNTFGLRMRGTKTFSIAGLNLETGAVGTGAIFEGCKQGDIKTVYVEGFSNGAPIYIKPIDGSALDDLAEFSSDITVDGVHGLSNAAGIVLIRPGVMNLTIKGVREYRHDAAGRESATGDWLRVTGVTNTQNGLMALQGINISSLNTSDKPMPDSLVKSSMYSQIFNLNGVIIKRDANSGYYGLTLQTGNTLVNTANGTKQIVVSSGTLTILALTATATTTANSRKITLTNTAGLFVGTYITVGAQEGIFVTKIERSTNTVWLGTAITATAAGVAVSYTAPVLI